MTVSGSTDFSVSANDMVILARRKAGVHADEEPLENVDLQSGLQALNMMLKAWQADGVMTWTIDPQCGVHGSQPTRTCSE